MGNCIANNDNVGVRWAQDNTFLSKEQKGEALGNLTPENKALLIESYLNLAVSIAAELHRHRGLTVDLDDLIGAGVEGLCRAVDNYDPDRFGAETTDGYFAKSIRGYIKHYLRGKEHTVRIPRLKRRLVKHSYVDIESKEDVLPEPSLNPEESMIERESRQRAVDGVRAFGETLKGFHREVFFGVMIGSEEPGELAERLGVPPKRVYSTTQMLKRRMKRNLENLAREVL